MIAERIRRWFLEHRRDLPWREEPSPYAVWVSEVMLQQTRVDVVVPYFTKWMQKFPTLAALARAEEGEGIKLWEGLGYYARARNLHQGAQEVMERYGGEVPDTLEKLLKIKGIGPYTANAILSFAFGKRAAALDANVLRVIARYSLFEKEAVSGYKELQKRVYDLLPEEAPHIVMEGLIELGALICQKQPKCSLCPLQEECLARKQGKAEALPLLKTRRETLFLERFVACVERQGAFLLKKNAKGKIMADLWEFPFTEEKERLEDFLGIKLQKKRLLLTEKQSFTHHRVVLHPVHFTTAEEKVQGYQWIPQEEFAQIPFSSGHRRISRQLLKK